MKFITENDLRVLYRKAAFTQFELDTDTRLTPGGRQFILDKRITILEAGKNQTVKGAETAATGTAPAATGTAPTAGLTADEPCASGPSDARPDTWLCARTRCVENLFFEVAGEIMDSDICLARDIMDLQPAVAAIRCLTTGAQAAGPLMCTACTGMGPDNFDQALGNCFEITPFHIQAGNGRQILKLDKLRCAMYELSALAGMSQDPQENVPEVQARIHQVINVLSQMICKAFGGKQCQRHE